MDSAAAVAGNGEKACSTKKCCGCGGAKSPGSLAALTLLAWGIQIPMLLIAVPKFAERLSDFGVQLPEISRRVIGLSEWMQSPIGGTAVTGAMVAGVAVVMLALFAFVLAKAGGGFGRALAVVLALAGGAIACGQAAAVIVPTMQAQRTVEGSRAAP